MKNCLFALLEYLHSQNIWTYCVLWYGCCCGCAAVRRFKALMMKWCWLSVYLPHLVHCICLYMRSFVHSLILSSIRIFSQRMVIYFFAGVRVSYLLALCWHFYTTTSKLTNLLNKSLACSLNRKLSKHITSFYIERAKYRNEYKYRCNFNFCGSSILIFKRKVIGILRQYTRLAYDKKVKNCTYDIIQHKNK